jgi:hypothetical protein
VFNYLMNIGASGFVWEGCRGCSVYVILRIGTFPSVLGEPRRLPPGKSDTLLFFFLLLFFSSVLFSSCLYSVRLFHSSLRFASLASLVFSFSPPFLSIFPCFATLRSPHSSCSRVHFWSFPPCCFSLTPFCPSPALSFPLSPLSLPPPLTSPCRCLSRHPLPVGVAGQ